MPLRELYEDHTLGTLLNTITGYWKAKGLEYKSGWEKARFVTVHLINAWLPPEEKYEDQRDFITFDWEKDYKKHLPERKCPGPKTEKVLTKDELKQLLKR